MRMNGERAHFEVLRQRAFWASAAYLRMVFAGGEPAKDIVEAGSKAVNAINRLRDSGEEW